MKIDTSKFYKRAAVTLMVKNRLVGGIPVSPDLIAAWMKAKMPAARQAEIAALSAKTLEEVAAAVEEKAEAGWTTFKRDGKGQLFFEGRCVKSMLKENANILATVLKPQGEKARKEAKENGSEGSTGNRFTNLKSKVAERLFVEQDEILMERKGVMLTEPDGQEERCIHIKNGPQGPRNALKRVDYVVAPLTLKFTLKWLADGIVDLDLIKVILDHAAINGLGADRSQGNGLFTYEIMMLNE